MEHDIAPDWALTDSPSVSEAPREVQRAADAFVNALDPAERGPWLAYMLEALEEEHGAPALREVADIIRARWMAGRW